MAKSPQQRPKFYCGAETALISHINPVAYRHVSLRALPKNLSASACSVNLGILKQQRNVNRVTDKDLYLAFGLGNRTVCWPILC